MTVVTYTVVDLDVSTACWTEIADKLRLAGYDHVFSRGGKRIDMTNIALVSEEGEMAQIEKDHEQADSRGESALVRPRERLLGRVQPSSARDHDGEEGCLSPTA